MEFRLTYRGRLPAAGSDKRAKDKQAIRKTLSPQLEQLWKIHPRLSSMFLNQHTWGDRIAKAAYGFVFIPLVCQDLGLTCSVDVMFLRRDEPGSIINSGGDIDNRLKVLFDGLRIPQNAEELAGDQPTAPNERFFCLMEDDKLITEVKVTTDRLLRPCGTNEAENDVELIIWVKTFASYGPTI